MKMRLHVEVVRTSNSVINSKDLSELVKGQLKSLGEVAVDSVITRLDSPQLEANVSSIHVCELETTSSLISHNQVSVGEESEGERLVSVRDVKLGLHVYRLYEGGCHVGGVGSSPQSEELGDGGDDGDQGNSCLALYWTLPTREFHGYWDSLVFDDDIKHRLLRYAWTMAQYSVARVDPSVISCNRIVLLHGPPGTGKTTLCKAVAQKLSIRLAHCYRYSVLVEINAHSLFSKYFSESGKLVSRLFMKLREVVSDASTLVCILLDEVESLAHSRQAAASSSEPSDSVRVVNALLTHLDHIKQSPNVLVMSTSNISGVVDGAFLDRADLSLYVPNPSAFAIYSIYLSCLLELIRVNMVEGPAPPKLQSRKAFDKVETAGDSGASLVKALSLLSVGLSGRTLRKVPILAHSYYLPASELVTLPQFVRAMQSVVQEIKNKNSCAQNNTAPVV